MAPLFGHPDNSFDIDNGTTIFSAGIETNGVDKVICALVRNKKIGLWYQYPIIYLDWRTLEVIKDRDRPKHTTPALWQLIVDECMKHVPKEKV